MSETAAQQRARIIAKSGLPAWQYDLAVALGYAPESWDGMWKLVADDPFTFREGVVIAREIVYKPGTHECIWTEDNSAKTRLKAHRWPDGFNAIETWRLTSPHRTYALGRYPLPD